MHSPPEHEITRLEPRRKIRQLLPLYPHILTLPSTAKEAALIRLLITWMICSGGARGVRHQAAVVVWVRECVCSVSSLAGHTPSLVTLNRARAKEGSTVAHFHQTLKNINGSRCRRGGYMLKMRGCPGARRQYKCKSLRAEDGTKNVCGA